MILSVETWTDDYHERREYERDEYGAVGLVRIEVCNGTRSQAVADIASATKKGSVVDCETSRLSDLS